jgi:hypothetical protein
MYLSIRNSQFDIRNSQGEEPWRLYFKTCVTV